MQLEQLIEWVRDDPEKVEAIVSAEREVETGRVEIHYHGGRWGTVRAIQPERKVMVRRPKADGDEQES